MEQAWAHSVAAGIDDRLFWALTPAETAQLNETIRDTERELQRGAFMRAGTVAAAIYNSTPGNKRRWTWKDFFEDESEQPPPDTPEGLRAALLQWATTTSGVKVSIS